MENPDEETVRKAPYAQVRRICESHFKNVSKAKGARMSYGNQGNRANFSKEVSAMMPSKLEDMWFSDEKTFTSMPKNQGARNDRVLIPTGKKKVACSVLLLDAQPLSVSSALKEKYLNFSFR